MPSQRPKLVIYTDEILINKIDEIAIKQNRSRGNLAETILKQYIYNYEKENGSINTVNIANNNSTINMNIEK